MAYVGQDEIYRDTSNKESALAKGLQRTFAVEASLRLRFSNSDFT